jgi:SPP1 family predicted phage head-tail adaptor
MRSIRSGRLKDLLTVQIATESDGEWGGIEESWVDHKTRKCEIRPLRAAEFYRSSGENVETTYEIRFRFEKGLLREDYRLIDKRVSPHRVFDIKAIVNTGNWGSEYVVTAVERKWPERA